MAGNEGYREAFAYTRDEDEMWNDYRPGADPRRADAAGINEEEVERLAEFAVLAEAVRGGHLTQAEADEQHASSRLVARAT